MLKRKRSNSPKTNKRYKQDNDTLSVTASFLDDIDKRNAKCVSKQFHRVIHVKPSIVITFEKDTFYETLEKLEQGSTQVIKFDQSGKLYKELITGNAFEWVKKIIFKSYPEHLDTSITKNLARFINLEVCEDRGYDTQESPDHYWMLYSYCSIHNGSKYEWMPQIYNKTSFNYKWFHNVSFKNLGKSYIISLAGQFDVHSWLKSLDLPLYDNTEDYSDFQYMTFGKIDLKLYLRDYKTWNLIPDKLNTIFSWLPRDLTKLIIVEQSGKILRFGKRKLIKICKNEYDRVFPQKDLDDFNEYCSQRKLFQYNT